MIQPRPLRAATGTLGWAMPDLGRWAVRGLAFALCLGSALALTAVRLEITRLRYELNDLHRRREALTAENARLGVELAALAAPRRIEERAVKLDLVYPDRGSVFVLDE
ncbi:MAG: FtsB/FtsL family cell division protein [Deferrisomatales bacterium]